MIPNDLNDWSLDLIIKLVEEGYFETERFDFKVDIPHKDDASGKERLEKSFCAFANTEGGFLIFGIRDSKKLSLEDRIIGIDPGADLPRLIGDKINNVEPSIYFDFKNPPIRIPNSKNIIHIIKIPLSPNRPHRTSKGEFFYRTNKGNELMSYQQIKDAFLGVEVRRQKLRLLYIELYSNKKQLESMLIPETDLDKTYSLITLDSAVLQSLLVDTYPLIINENELINLLLQIRQKTRIINNEKKILFTKVSLPLSHIDEIVKNHNQSIKEKVTNLLPEIESALAILRDKYGFD